MKYSSIAVLALIGAVSAVNLNRRHYSPIDPEYYASLSSDIQMGRGRGDAFDGDENSVSQYDDGHKIPYEAFKKREDKKADDLIQMQSELESFQMNTFGKKLSGKDAYDLDGNTASEYDDASNINGGNPYAPVIKGQDPETPAELDIQGEQGKILKQMKAEKAAADKKALPKPAKKTAAEKAQKAEAKAEAKKALEAAAPKKEEDLKKAAEVINEETIKERTKDGIEKKEGEIVGAASDKKPAAAETKAAPKAAAPAPAPKAAK